MARPDSLTEILEIGAAPPYEFILRACSSDFPWETRSVSCHEIQGKGGAGRHYTAPPTVVCEDNNVNSEVFPPFPPSWIASRSCLNGTLLTHPVLEDFTPILLPVPLLLRSFRPTDWTLALRSDYQVPGWLERDTSNVHSNWCRNVQSFLASLNFSKKLINSINLYPQYC